MSSDNNNNNADEVERKGRKGLYLSDALRTLDIYRWEGDGTDDDKNKNKKRSNYLLLTKSAELPMTKVRVDDWDDVFNGQGGKAMGEEMPLEEQLKDEIPKELIAAFDLNREPPPQPGSAELEELQRIDTNELQDEICDAFAVMCTEIQLRIEQEEEEMSELATSSTSSTASSTSPSTTTTTTTTTSTQPAAPPPPPIPAPAPKPAPKRKEAYHDPTSWVDVDSSVGVFSNGEVVYMPEPQTLSVPLPKKTKNKILSKLKAFTTQWMKRKQKKGPTEADRLQQAIDVAKQISRNTELIQSYDYGPQRFFFGKSTLEMSIRECFNIQAVSDSGKGVVIEKILNEELVERFIRKWWYFKKEYGEDSIEAKVRLVFHGTRRSLLENITKTGLRIPDEIPGVFQLNGAVHGRGVYVSRHCNIAMGYSSDFTVLVCAAVLGKIARGSSLILKGHNCNVVDWSSSGDCIVLYESDQVLPLYVTNAR